MRARSFKPGIILSLLGLLHVGLHAAPPIESPTLVVISSSGVTLNSGDGNGSTTPVVGDEYGPDELAYLEFGAGAELRLRDPATGEIYVIRAASDVASLTFRTTEITSESGFVEMGEDGLRISDDVPEDVRNLFAMSLGGQAQADMQAGTGLTVSVGGGAPGGNAFVPSSTTSPGALGTQIGGGGSGTSIEDPAARDGVMVDPIPDPDPDPTPEETAEVVLGTAPATTTTTPPGAAPPTTGISDRRLKRDIEFIGLSPSGVRIYQFRYVESEQLPGIYRGAMAQDLLQTTPSAVKRRADGFLTVDYSQTDVKFIRIR